MALVGYALVSSVGQKSGCPSGQLTHCDKISRTKPVEPPQTPPLGRALDDVRESDTLVVPLGSVGTLRRGI